MQLCLCNIQPELSPQFFEDLWDGSLNLVYLANHRNKECDYTNLFAISLCILIIMGWVIDLFKLHWIVESNQIMKLKMILPFLCLVKWLQSGVFRTPRPCLRRWRTSCHRFMKTNDTISHFILHWNRSILVYSNSLNLLRNRVIEHFTSTRRMKHLFSTVYFCMELN